MRKLRIGILDLVTKAPTRSMWARVMHANFASIMPQMLGAWCKQDGHDVKLMCYTGFEKLPEDLPKDVDLFFISAFSHAAQLTYALSNLLRSRGVVTVLGGPHARCYPQDAVKYFDYVVGFTDRTLIREILQDCSQHRPIGRHLAAKQQPQELPGVKERWEFIEPTLDKAPLIKMIPMIGSLGCPYTCNFCIDSTVPYQQLSFDVIKEDLRFLLTKFKRPRVAWQDPNFGVRFDDYLGAIEEAAPPGSITFFAESSLSLLSEERLKRLRRNGFDAILPGVESWFGMGNKSKVGKSSGMEKVRSVADQINTVLQHVPYLQANFVLGLDVDEGPDPFELTKRFVDLSPGAYPAYSLLTAFGQAAPLNLEYQRANRIVPVPFHFLNTQHAMNLKPKNYTWPEFFNYLADLTAYTFSWKAIRNRLKANGGSRWKYINVLRGATSQGRGRIKFYTSVRDRLNTDKKFRDFFEGETTEIPQLYIDSIRTDLGPLWDWLPEGALYHDPNAYLKSEQEQLPQAAVAGRR